MSLFGRSLYNTLENLLIYNQKRLDTFIKNELELQIEWIYIHEYKKHHFILETENLKIEAQKLYSLLVLEYSRVNDLTELLKFLKLKIK